MSGRCNQAYCAIAPSSLGKISIAKAQSILIGGFEVKNLSYAASGLSYCRLVAPFCGSGRSQSS
jgi:hypothetical protein